MRNQIHGFGAPPFFGIRRSLSSNDGARARRLPSPTSTKRVSRQTKSPFLISGVANEVSLRSVSTSESYRKCLLLWVESRSLSERYPERKPVMEALRYIKEAIHLLQVGDLEWK